MSSLVFFLAAFLSGMAMAVQGSLNAVLGKAAGLLEATFFVHLTASIVVAALLLLGIGSGQLAGIAKAPWYTYLGGAIGVAITYGVAMSIPRLGVAVATTVIIVGQVGTAALIDHLGLFGLDPIPFNWYKAAGLLLLAGGARLLLN